MAVPDHEMEEDQVLIKLSGALAQPERLISCRSGLARYRSGHQRCRSAESSGERMTLAWTLDRTVRDRLTRFRELDAKLELQILSRLRRLTTEEADRQASFAAFWGRLHLAETWPSVFGSDAEGELVFRRGPWETWPFDLPAFAELDPSVPILLSPYCATLFHEAVGHALEAEYLELSPLKYRFGEQISHRELTIADRPDLSGYAGSMQLDDTGRAASGTTLLHRGHLVGDLAHEKGTWRRASYRELPQIRASNFIIRAGSEDAGAMLAAHQRCYYVAWIRSGSWQPGTHRIKIMTGPIFYTERGEALAKRDWARLDMGTADLLDRIEAVGDDFEMDPAVHWCVKKHQPVPMGMGAPSILIGGRA